MASSEGFLPASRRYCSVMTALDNVLCPRVVAAASSCCRNAVAVHPACHPMALSPCLLGALPWPEKPQHGLPMECFFRGARTFLVELAEPVVVRGRPPVRVQRAIEDDILEYVHGMKHSLLPGDKVLAPWEPDMVRFGPGTVLVGIETRDPLRASEDEEIMVQFWNGKEVKLPLGVALWIPPSRWERIVEMIHMPFTSRLKARKNPDTNSCFFSCSPVAVPVPLCTLGSLSRHNLLCWLHLHQHCGGTCCSSVHVGCICCCHPRTEAWWPLPSHSLVLPKGKQGAEPSSKPSLRLPDLEGPKQEFGARCGVLPDERAVMHRAGNTNSSLLEKPKLRDSARPAWKYWKRSQHKSILAIQLP
uniref:DUF4537 domain-containing protein n=1 Tax=Nothoprocta perdicaria TaxID=30464 RepID=A0A8C6ZMZ7_NOTPE